MPLLFSVESVHFPVHRYTTWWGFISSLLMKCLFFSQAVWTKRNYTGPSFGAFLQPLQMQRHPNLSTLPCSSCSADPLRLRLKSLSLFLLRELLLIGTRCQTRCSFPSVEIPADVFSVFVNGYFSSKKCKTNLYLLSVYNFITHFLLNSSFSQTCQFGIITEQRRLHCHWPACQCGCILSHKLCLCFPIFFVPGG